MIPVFYTPKMVADSESASPSAGKPEKVVASWQGKFAIEIIEPHPVTVADLDRAHDPAFVRGVLDRKIPNGFGNRSAAVARSLPYTSGAMLSAARHAIMTGRAAAAPCSGFHHATWDQCMGFCTFNGLMVTALALIDDAKEGVGRPERIGILDLDMHYGNGTDHIIDKLGLNDTICHFTGGKQFTSPTQVHEFFDTWLPRALAKMSGCDVVLYQAGADPHVDDPHGGWLTTKELRRRDRMVFAALRTAKVPVAWNLAGGYQVERDGSIPKVLEIHDNTMSECALAFAVT